MMKPSEALRAGIGKAKHTTGNYFRYQDGQLCACAVGMMALGAGFDVDRYFSSDGYKSGVSEFLARQFPSLDGHKRDVGLGEIISWNDRDELTPEQIADKLEALGY